MKSSDRKAAVDEIRDLAPIIAVGYLPTVTKLHEFAGGYPNGTGGGGKGGHSDRTQALALKSDPYVRDLGLFDAALELARDALWEAHQIILVATQYKLIEEKIE